MIAEIEDSTVMNISSIYRFSGSNLIQPESVGDHVAECVGLASIFYSKFPVFNWEKLVYYVSIHDLGECYTGDIVRPVKYSSEEMKKMMDELEYNLLAKNLCTFIAQECLEAKHKDEIESVLASFIDVFQAAYKIYREYKLQGLHKFIDALDYSVSVLNERCLPELEKYADNKEADLLVEFCKSLTKDLEDFVEKES